MDKPLRSVIFQNADGSYSDVYAVQDDTARKNALAAVKTVNGVAPDKNGNVDVNIEGSGAETPGAGGEDGGYYTPNLDEDGNLYWTPSKESMPEVPEACIKGPKGDTGDTGAQGPQGETGPQGTAGRGVSSMTYDSGTKLWTVTYTDGTSASVAGPSIPALSSSVSSTSTDTAATSSAVKQAYDLANAAMPKSGGTFTGAAYALSGAGTAAQLRNTALYAAETDPTVNGQINWTYE